ncbi:MazG nucleotide pyrophosphohydrolase domain-containing protein [Candidatus Bipolaricaulota bacterium]
MPSYARRVAGLRELLLPMTLSDDVETGGNMPQLDNHPTLADFQAYVVELEVERGFGDQSSRDKCLLLGEEVGELFKAVRKIEGLKVDAESQFGMISEELADIFIYVCAIANRYSIDLEAAFREKEAINHQREWIEQGDLFEGFETQPDDKAVHEDTNGAINSAEETTT